MVIKAKESSLSSEQVTTESERATIYTICKLQRKQRKVLEKYPQKYKETSSPSRCVMQVFLLVRLGWVLCFPFCHFSFLPNQILGTVAFFVKAKRKNHVLCLLFHFFPFCQTQKLVWQKAFCQTNSRLVWQFPFCQTIS